MTWSILGTIADIVGIIGAVAALLGWLNTRRIKKNQEQEKKRLAARIQIHLVSGKKMYRLPWPVRRSDLTRAEVMGRLGMIPMKKQEVVREGEKQKRFAIEYVNTDRFFALIESIRDGDGDSILNIECSPKEYEQFDLLVERG